MLRIHDELVRWCESHGVERVAALTGAMRQHDREEQPAASEGT